MSLLSSLPSWGFLLVVVWVVGALTLVLSVVAHVRDLVVDIRRSRFLKLEAENADRLLAQAREVHRLAPSAETRLLVVFGEACRDLVGAARVEDWEKYHAFKHQAETIDFLLARRRSMPVDTSMDQAHQELVRMAVYN